MLNDYVTVSEAIEILQKTKGHRYHRSRISALCLSKELDAIKKGHAWLILKSSIDSFEPARPGLKTGQKINRPKK